MRAVQSVGPRPFFCSLFIMSDANSLRTILTRVDATAPGIQGSASAMMKHYDRSSGVAVVEWRNALHNAQREQWIPLIYVANEVLQNSKRNRGNKFLEAFSPVLGQSLIFVCQHSDAPVVEKIRRTVKIWGDRRVFSVRYVNELLKGLEPYRNNRGASANPIIPPPSQSPASPPQPTPSPHQSATTSGSNNSQANKLSDKSKDNASDDDSEDPMDILNGDNDDSQGASDDDDDSNVFGDSESGGLKLDVQVSLDSATLQNNGQQQRKDKRRRSSTASSGSQASASKRARRRTALSTNTLMELWKRVGALEQSFDHSMAMVKDIQLPEPEQLESLVGDELLDHHKTICKYQERVSQQREHLHSIANERKSMEQDAVRYIPWLEAALKQDGEDLEFCKTLEATLLKFQHIHPAIREARDKRVAEDLKYQREQEEKERKRKEDEESKKFREMALSKETEAKTGMVWNKVTQEYQYLNTDESWRD